MHIHCQPSNSFVSTLHCYIFMNLIINVVPWTYLSFVYQCLCILHNNLYIHLAIEFFCNFLIIFLSRSLVNLILIVYKCIRNRVRLHMLYMVDSGIKLMLNILYYDSWKCWVICNSHWIIEAYRLLAWQHWQHELRK